jgi:hypothetical protein
MTDYQGQYQPDRSIASFDRRWRSELREIRCGLDLVAALAADRVPSMRSAVLRFRGPARVAGSVRPPAKPSGHAPMAVLTRADVGVCEATSANKEKSP